MSAPALVTLASAMAALALVVLALSASGIVHSGGLSFSAGSKSVAVKRFVIDLGAGRPDRRGGRNGAAHSVA
jgi:hypothetical protein